jgi:hypothetical protein
MKRLSGDSELIPERDGPNYFKHKPAASRLAQLLVSHPESTASKLKAQGLVPSEPGAIRILEDLEGHGIVVAETRGRGRHWTVSDRWRAWLESMPAEEPPRTLGAGSRLVLVSSDEKTSTARALLDEDVRSAVDWAAIFDDSSIGAILRLRGVSSSTAIEPVFERMRTHGLQVRSAVVECVSDSDADLVSWAREALGLDRGPRALSATSPGKPGQSAVPADHRTRKRRSRRST